LQSLEKIDSGDYLVYADIGCEFVANEGDNLRKKLEALESSDIVGFRLKGGGLKERFWTKASVFAFFNVLNNKRYTESNQIKSGVIFVKKTPKSIAFMKQWLDIMKKDFSLISDSPSTISNLAGFKAHRHDQSIFSILMKKHGFFTYEDYFTFDSSDVSFGIVDSRKKATLYDFSPKDRFLFNILSKISLKSSTRKAFRRLSNPKTCYLLEE